MGGVKGALTKAIGMAKAQGVIKEVEKEEPKKEEPKQEAKEASETKRLLRTKRRGRSSTVLSSASGVTDEASVSKKTLLGS